MLVYTSARPNLSVWMTSCSRSVSAKLQQHHLRIHNVSIAFFFLWHFDPIPGHGLYFTGLYNHCHLSAPHTVGLFWTSDQPDAETLLASTQRSQETDIRAPGRT